MSWREEEPGTPAERRFKAAVQMLVETYVYPSPAAIRDLLYRQAQLRGDWVPPGGPAQRNNLCGRECTWRREVLEALEWKWVGRWGGSDHQRSWEPPAGWVEQP